MVGYTNKNTRDDGTEEQTDLEGVFTGVSVSAYNNIKGEQRGVTFGVVNRTTRIKGVQFGLINIVKENRKGLRVLPIFNTRFKARSNSQQD